MVSTVDRLRALSKCFLVSLAATAAMLSSACSADYDDRMSYLREVALRGLETHNLLRNQGTGVNEQSCKIAQEGLIDDIPSDNSGDPEPSKEWTQLVQQTFMRACTTGRY